MLTLNRLLGDDKARRLAETGLHKVAAARLRLEGHSVPESLDLRSAIQALGTNVYVKSASFKKILEGLVALDSLDRS